MTKKQKKMLTRILISAAVFVVAAVVSRIWALPWYLLLAIYLAGYLVCGWDVVTGAVRNIFHGQLFDEKFLMSLATVGAFASGEYAEGLMVMILYQVGELFQSYAVGPRWTRMR